MTEQNKNRPNDRSNVSSLDDRRSIREARDNRRRNRTGAILLAATVLGGGLTAALVGNPDAPVSKPSAKEQSVSERREAPRNVEDLFAGISVENEVIILPAGTTLRSVESATASSKTPENSGDVFEVTEDASITRPLVSGDGGVYIIQLPGEKLTHDDGSVNEQAFGAISFGDVESSQLPDSEGKIPDTASISYMGSQLEALFNGQYAPVSVWNPSLPTS